MTAPTFPGLTFYPSGTHLTENVVRSICSEHGGITHSLLVAPIARGGPFDLKSVSVQMPGYHRVLLDTQSDMQYHLGGYGTFHEEALIRLVGESIERYALMVGPSLMADRIRYGTYDEIAKSGRVVPLEYLRLFSDEDYGRLNRGDFHGIRRLERTDVVGWIQCPSLFEPDAAIWTPAQMLFVGYKFSRPADEVPFSPGFSTGTAAHTSIEHALLSALLEFVEIDALMLRWYTEMAAPRVTPDNLNVAELVSPLLGPDARYEVIPLDLSVLHGVDAHVVASVLLNKREERPYLTLGAQGHLNPVKALYRSLTEAAAISFLGTFGALFLPKQYLSRTRGDFTDLDSNVAYFASPEQAAAKRAVINRLTSGRRVLSGMKNHESGDSRADTARLIEQLSRFSEYGVVLDITPPETASRGWKVMRVFIPELVTMCVPGVPYSEHPRIKAHGGIRNDRPHPLP